jgi:hypothetical protein
MAARAQARVADLLELALELALAIKTFEAKEGILAGRHPMLDKIVSSQHENAKTNDAKGGHEAFIAPYPLEFERRTYNSQRPRFAGLAAILDFAIRAFLGLKRLRRVFETAVGTNLMIALLRFGVR